VLDVNVGDYQEVENVACFLQVLDYLDDGHKEDERYRTCNTCVLEM
jgi:hypothetical protein